MCMQQVCNDLEHEAHRFTVAHIQDSREYKYIEEELMYLLKTAYERGLEDQQHNLSGEAA